MAARTRARAQASSSKKRAITSALVDSPRLVRLAAEDKIEAMRRDVDEMSRAGLIGLGNQLRRRTSYEPLEPMGVDVAKDDLSFFPLLYWPMDPREKDLTPQALSKIADYMRNGGTILFDGRDVTRMPVQRLAAAWLARSARTAAAGI